MYDFYLGGVQLPVAPGELKISIANQNSTYVLVDQGEIKPAEAGRADGN